MKSEQPSSTDPITRKPQVNKMPLKKVLLAILILVLIAAGVAAYWLRDKKAKDLQKSQQAEISLLQQKTIDLEKQLADAKAAATETKKQTTTTTPTQTTIDNVKASISSGNTAALEGYMASTVRVVIAASEGIGDRTPAQAVGDITDYLKNATDPWNFALPSATLTKYSTGDYAQYFPTGAVVGKSANNFVISFSFDNNGKISKVFMAVNDSLL